MPAPVFQAVGTLSNSSAASVNVSWPTHQTNDIGLLVIETSGGGGTLAPPSGWAAAPSTPVTDIAGAGGSKLHVWWKRAASNAEAAVATGFSTSDHVAGRIFTFRGCVTTGNPWDVTTTGVKTSASSTATVPAVTTTVADTLIVMIVGRPDDSNSTIHFGVPTNANLTGLAEAAESGYASGNGGGFVVSYGTKTTAGDTGTSTLTKANSTNDTYVVIALKQPTTDYTLTADKATFNDTFVDAGLLYGRRFIGDAQSYALTGRDAGLNKGLSMPADRATFTLTGRDANFPRAYRLTADKATFTFTGRDAGTLYGRRFAADFTKFFLPERNMRLWSESFDNAAWTKTSSSITANATTAPDGTLTADALIENTTQSTGHTVSRNITFVTNRTYTHSCYFKLYPGPITRYARLRLGGTTVFGTDTFININLATGAIIGTSGSPSATSITNAGNGWYRASITKQYTGAGVASNLAVTITSTTGTNLYTDADGQSGIYIWGAQYEEDSLTDYDPIGPAAAGRTDLRVARRLTADARTYALTGNDATLTRTTVGAYTLTADKATFTFTGRDAGLRAARRIAADTSAFTLTGYNVALTKTGSYALLASPQSYALTGRNANLAASRRLTADARAFTVTGNAANLFASRRLTASLGTYTLAAYPVDLKRGYLRRRIIIF